MYHLVLLTILLYPPAQDRKPEWITNPGKIYPNVQYLTAVGMGDSRKEAENVAASNLSKIFESKIRSEETISARHHELMKSSGADTRSDNRASLESQTDVERKVSVSTGQTLINIRYPESYTDNLGRVYALAIIEREPTAAIYDSKIDDNDARIAAFINNYEELKDPLKKFANIGAALVTTKVNETLREQLQIILPGSPVPSDTTHSSGQVAEMYADALKRIPFSIDVRGSERNEVTGMVSDMLSGLGFPVANKGILAIEGDESVEEIDLKSGQKFVRWSCRLSVYDISRTAIISISASGREGHLTYGEAVARALRTMREKIKTDFSRKIERYFDGLVMK